MRGQSSRAKALVQFIARNLASKPDRVFVVEVIGGPANLIELEVDKEDLGRLIGRSGRVADAIRALLQILTLQEGRMYELEIIDAARPTVEEGDPDS
ncbi:MAG: KH domain-containing protein [Chloroflexi bacterium]|nr:KH domain-containing protein [Chloroflexota bacterium]